MFPTGLLTTVLQTAARKNNVGLEGRVCVCVRVCVRVCVHVCACVCVCVHVCVFWLSGFMFPTGFLTAVLQTAARKNNVCLEGRVCVCVCMCVCSSCLGSCFPLDCSPQSCKLQLGRIMCALRDVCVCVCACVWVLVVWVHVSHRIAHKNNVCLEGRVCMCVCFGCLGSCFPQDSSPQSCKLQLGRIMCSLRDVCGGGGGGEESERMWGRCEKGKVKESERRLSASVMNSFLAFVHG